MNTGDHVPGRNFDDYDRLQEALSIIRADVAALQAQMEILAERIMASLTSVHGNGDSPGMKTRLDRVEQDLIRRGKFFWVVTSATFGLIVERLLALVKHDK